MFCYVYERRPDYMNGLNGIPLRVRCMRCQQKYETGVESQEQLSAYAPNEDGTYRTLIGLCASCMGEAVGEQPRTKASPELLAIAAEREPTEAEAREGGICPRIVDEAGSGDNYDLTWEAAATLKATGWIAYCPSCTQKTIIDGEGEEDAGYTAAEFHTLIALCDAEDPDAYMAQVLQAVLVALGLPVPQAEAQAQTDADPMQAVLARLAALESKNAEVERRLARQERETISPELYLGMLAVLAKKLSRMSTQVLQITDIFTAQQAAIAELTTKVKEGAEGLEDMHDLVSPHTHDDHAAIEHIADIFRILSIVFVRWDAIDARTMRELQEHIAYLRGAEVEP